MWENKCFLQKQRTNLKVDLCRKYHPPPWKPAEHGWTAPAHSSFSFQSSSSAPEGARTHAHFKHRSISQWNLNKVKWRTLCKKGCRQFHPSNTSSKQQRNSREAQSLSLFSPSPHFLVFYFPTICNRKMLILFILFFFFFSGIWESNLWRKFPLWGGVSDLVEDRFVWQMPQGRPSRPQVLAPPGWVRVSRWIA